MSILNIFRRFDKYAHAGAYPSSLTGLQVLSLRAEPLIATEYDCLLVDTSKWQGEINYQTMVRQGVKGTIMKCGQAGYIDPRFKENWAKAGAIGLKRGSYYYFDSRFEPREQARKWFEFLGGDYGELVHFGDYEETYNGAYAGIENFKIFMTEFQRLTRLPDNQLGVYTGFYYWVENGSTDLSWSRYWLWIAWYSAAGNVLVPAPWKESSVWAWQFTDHLDGVKYGVSSRELDGNWFVKGLDVYELMYGMTPDYGEEPIMELGNFEVWSNSYNMKLRSAASANAPQVGDVVPMGTVMKADAMQPPSSGGLATDKWARVTDPVRLINGQPVEVWVAVVHNGVTYCQVRRLDERPMPTVSFVFQDRDGVTYEALNVPLQERPE